MIAYLTQGMSIAFAAGAQPGPFITFLIGRTLAQGWRNSIILILTPLVTDVPIVLVVLLILKQFPPELVRLIQLVGGLYLLWIAYRSWKQFRTGGVAFKADDRTAGIGQGKLLLQGAVMGWLSPGPYIFWTTLNGPLLVRGLNESLFSGLGFLLGFYGTFIGILTVYVLVFDRLRQIDERVTRGIIWLTLVVMVGFGTWLILQGLGVVGT